MLLRGKELESYVSSNFFLRLLNGQSFSDEILLKNNDLLEALQDDGSKCIKKYKGIYFTGNKSIDRQILSAISSVNSGYDLEYSMKGELDSNNDNYTVQNEKLEKLLLILGNIIAKRQEFGWYGLKVSKKGKKNIESILLTAIDKYSMNDLELLCSFKNITFDILKNLELLDDIPQNQISEIMQLLLQEVGTEIFPTCMDKNNIKNIVTNILYLKEYQKDKLKLFQNSELNSCFLLNGKGSIVDLLLLPQNYFKIVMISTYFEVNLFSLNFPGYEFYKHFFYGLRNSKLTEDQLSLMIKKIDHGLRKDWVLFRIDKGFPVETLISNIANINMSYQHCSYIYENITQDPIKLYNLFKFDYDTLLYIYTNTTKNIDDIIDLHYVLQGVNLDSIKAIYEVLNDFDLFKRLLRHFDDNYEIGPHTFNNIAFLGQTFKDDFVDRLKNNVWVDLLTIADISEPANIKYLYESGLCKTIDDYISIKLKILFSAKVDNIKLLYENGLCKTIDDLSSIQNISVLLGNPENVKFLYETGMCGTIEDFDSIKDNDIFIVNAENLKTLYNNGICVSVENFDKYLQIAGEWDSESIDILSTLYAKKDNYEERLQLFGKINQSNYSNDHKNDIIHKIGKLPISTAEKYVKVLELLDNSNSFDIQIVKDNLIMDILNSENLEYVTKKIDAVFLESNVPYISKIFQVFKYIYPEDTFNDRMKNHSLSSRYLQSCKTYEKKLGVIYQDLMNITIKSNESSLRQYINEVISCKKILYDFENGKILDSEGCRQILSLMKKIQSLSVIINNNGIRNMDIFDHIGEIDYETLKEYYNNLKKFLLLRENDSIYTFFLNLCKRIGYKSLEDILIDMDKSQLEANNNGLEKYNSIQKGEIFNHLDNYFLKGINLESLGEILNRGVTSTEYLGGGEGTSDRASSNGTPFDTDGVVVNGENLLKIAESHGYGNLAIVINTNKPIIYDTNTGLQGYDSKLYELFKNHGEDCDYHGIRTGIASTEFEAIIYELTDIECLQQIKYLIAKKGFYLPVLDLKGNLLFTPDEYHSLRKNFSFSYKYKGYDTERNNGTYISTIQNYEINKGNEEYHKFIQEQRDSEKLNVNIDNETMAKLVFDKIKDILESELGIKCNQNKDLLSAELYDSGSTGRGTEIPSNDIDLDFTLLLSADDYKKIDEIQKLIHEKIGTIEKADHGTVDGIGLQIKSSKNLLGKEYGYKNGIQFDLLILKKTKSYLYPSNIAMQDRLEKVKELYGKDTLDFVKENIVIMKKLLKSQGTYKNTEGGMGGIGVENRIMQYHGNFIEALESFEEIAFDGKYTEGKKSISFEEFKNIYTIRDSGQNFKDGKNDNYVLKMNEVGYDGILNIIKEYRTQGLKGIYKLIQRYQEIKAQYTN